MKSGSKYYSLYERLSQCKEDSITLAMDEIETLISSKLPTSARTTRGWWSNRSKGGHQSNAWVDAGFQTDFIDIEQQTVTFKRFEAEYIVIKQVDGEIRWDQVAIRALRKHMQMTQSQFAETMGVRRQTVSEWENGVYAPDRSTLKHLSLVAEKEAFQPEFDEPQLVEEVLKEPQ